VIRQGVLEFFRIEFFKSCLIEGFVSTKGGACLAGVPPHQQAENSRAVIGKGYGPRLPDSGYNTQPTIVNIILHGQTLLKLSLKAPYLPVCQGLFMSLGCLP